MVEAAEDAALLLEEQGVHATVWDARVVKPLDPTMICDAANHPVVVTVEDGVRSGGAGAAIVDAVGELQDGVRPRRMTVLGTPDNYIAQAKPAQILSNLGLDGPGIATAVVTALRSELDARADH